MVKIEPLEKYEAITLGTIAGLNQVIFVINFIFAIYNTVKHLVPLRITQPLILLFYILTYLISISLMVETTQRTFFPERDIFNYDLDLIGWGCIARCIKEVLVVAIFILVIVTMYQLAGSIQILLSEITVESANCRNTGASIISIVFTILFATAVVMNILLVPENFAGNTMFLTYAGTYTLQCLLYSLIIIFLA